MIGGIKMIKKEQEKCFNTLAHGCVWGKEVADWAEINKLAQKDGFTKSNITYMGNILTYDTNKAYAFFRNRDMCENYLMEI
jgi:hypothetical protein